MSSLRRTASTLLTVSCSVLFVAAAAVPASAAGPVAASPARALPDLPAASGTGELCLESRQVGQSGMTVTTPRICFPVPTP